MGWIIELEPLMPQSRPLATVKRRRSPPVRIEADTPILPRAVAAAVCDEAAGGLGTELPVEWVSMLEARARAVYSRNPKFRRLIRGPGNSGRDWLWAFSRHWLAARLQRDRPSLYGWLPSAYKVGHPLPARAA